MGFVSKLQSLNYQEGFVPWLASMRDCQGVPGSNTGCPEHNQAARFAWNQKPICSHCIEQWRQEVARTESTKAGEPVAAETYDRYGRVDIRWHQPDTKGWYYVLSSRAGRGANVCLISG